MSTNSKGKIEYALQSISIIPLLIFGITILILGNHLFTNAMYDEVEVELQGAASNLLTMFDLAYPGDYTLQGEEIYRLYKGDTDITFDYSIIDHVKASTDLDISLFYKDTRILTTIIKDGERIVGSAAPETVMEEVFSTGEARFYEHIIIYNTPYFSYYTPIHNSDGSVVGILFVGKPRATVDTAIKRSIYPLVLVDLIAIVIISIAIYIYMHKFGLALMRLDKFLANVESGNLNADLHNSVTARSDELGAIGRMAVNMQHSLRSMIEQDTLTELFNRRSADRRLRQIIEKSHAGNLPFCLAIGDIDHFKKVNDTFGHNCGDLILKNVAEKLRKHMHARGFVARWGGEEFLLVFDQMTLEEARDSLEELLNTVRAMKTPYNEEEIQVTMTFGIVQGNSHDIHELVRQADDLLYEGKCAGRNRIVSPNKEA